MVKLLHTFGNFVAIFFFGVCGESIKRVELYLCAFSRPPTNFLFLLQILLCLVSVESTCLPFIKQSNEKLASNYSLRSRKSFERMNGQRVEAIACERQIGIFGPTGCRRIFSAISGVPNRLKET